MYHRNCTGTVYQVLCTGFVIPLTTKDHFCGSSSEQQYLVKFIVELRFVYYSIAYFNCMSQV